MHTFLGVILPQCVGCPNVHIVMDTSTCSKLAMPSAQHTRVGGCHMRPKGKVMEEKGVMPKFIDPLKASKQAMKARIKASKPNKKMERRDSR